MRIMVKFGNPVDAYLKVESASFSIDQTGFAGAGRRKAQETDIQILRLPDKLTPLFARCSADGTIIPAIAVEFHKNKTGAPWVTYSFKNCVVLRIDPGTTSAPELLAVNADFMSANYSAEAKAAF